MQITLWTGFSTNSTENTAEKKRQTEAAGSCKNATHHQRRKTVNLLKQTLASCNINLKSCRNSADNTEGCRPV